MIKGESEISCHLIQLFFLPRDAMHGPVSVSVRVCVCHKSVFSRNG